MSEATETATPKLFFVEEQKTKTDKNITEVVKTSYVVRNLDGFKNRFPNFIESDEESLESMLLSGGAKALGLKISEATDKDRANHADEFAVLESHQKFTTAEAQVEVIRKTAINEMLAYLNKLVPADSAMNDAQLTKATEKLKQFYLSTGLRKDVVIKWIKDNQDATSTAFKKFYAQILFDSLVGKKKEDSSIEKQLERLTV